MTEKRESKATIDSMASSDATTGQEKHVEADVEPYEEPLPAADEIMRPNLLARTLSRKSAASSWADPGPPPDGGLQAWLQILACHLTVFSTWGWITSFGVFQSYYANTLGLQPSAISWLGSIQIFLLFFLGTFTGRALDAGLFRPVYMIGTVFQLLGIFTMSVSTKYWQLICSQAVAMGIANGCHFCPSLALAATYFDKKRPFALGLTAVGSCTGGIVFPIIVQQLLPRIGFGWTIRVCGFIMVFTNVVSLAIFRTRLPPRKSGPLVEWSAFSEAPYMLFVLGMFFNFWAIFFAFFFVGAYARNILGVSYADSINLLLTMVAIGIPGRLIPNYFATQLGPFNVMLPFVLLSGVMMYAWAGINSVGALFAFAALYGTGSAGLQSMFPPTLASLTKDIRKTGVRMGMGFSVVSFATLTGPPIAGALIQANGGNYLYAQIWGGTSFLIALALMIAARQMLVGRQVICKI